MSTVLWRERDLLGIVVTGLVQPGPAVADALADLEDVQKQRRLVVDQAGTALGLPPGCTLADLAGAAPEPWNDLLRRHIAALMRATSEMVAAAGEGVGGHDIASA